MTTLSKTLLLLLISSTVTLAEDPVTLGLQGALNTFKTVPTKTAKQAEDTAIQILRPYLRPSPGGHYTRTKGGSWIEVRNLRFKSVTLSVVSEADRANGITDRLLVHLDADMHRSQKSAQAWSEWRNGMPGFLPRTIRIEQQNGRWNGNSAILGILEATNDQAITIPSSQISQGTSAPIAIRQPNSTQQPHTTRPSKPKTNPAPPEIGKSIVGTFVDALIAITLGFLFLGALLISSIVFLRKRARISRRSPQPSNTSPEPPPLPQGTNHLDLMTRREFLMTDAEQKFYAVLEAAATSACRISSKVRLADLFDVARDPGHQSAFNKICSKHIDFVLTEPGTSRILCAIELDDSSHQRPDRIERDKFVNQLFATKGPPLLRVPWAPHYDLHSLRHSLSTLMGRALA